MLSINTNLSSLIAQRSMKTSTLLLNQAIERMSTGFKVNHAKDNAAAYSIITNMDTKIGAYQVAEDNCAMGLDMLSTATDSLDLIYDKLTRLRDLAEQASNGTYGEQSLKAINSEANALVDEINRIYSTTEYNGIKLFDQETQIPDDPNIPKPQYNGFIKEVIKRDTSTMATLASVDPNTDLADGTYSISTPEEMKKLADMTNAGLVSAGDEFVLANDIDLLQYENWTPIGEVWYDGAWQGNWFYGSFDGNGYMISNLNIRESKHGYLGLFGGVDSRTIKKIENLKLKNVDIQVAWQQSGALIGIVAGSHLITNCSIVGGAVSIYNNYCTGGIIGNLGPSATIDSCYSDVNVSGRTAVGGIVGVLRGVVQNCCSLSRVCAQAENDAGGIAGYSQSSYAKILNSYTDVTNVRGNVFAGQCVSGAFTISGSFYSYNEGNCNYNLVADELIGGATISNVIEYKSDVSKIYLQVGIDSGALSSISFDTFTNLSSINYLKNIGIAEAYDFISSIDRVLDRVFFKQTELGAMQNRLESALDEISTQYENLVSSRSTLRDADIAEVSTQYIQQQILQQAASTLLSTANQSPSIALQLL